MKKSLFEMSTNEVEEKLKETTTIVVPVGSVEQHGPHLPLGADYMQAHAIAEATANKLGAVFAPLIPFGHSPYHMSWPGTISIRPQVYIEVVKDICTCLATHGFKHILLINGHAGNNAPLELAALGAIQETDAKVFVIHYWLVMLQIPPFNKWHISHGGNHEVTGTMAYNPELVDLSKAKGGLSIEEVQDKIKSAAWGEREGVGAGFYLPIKSFRNVGAESGFWGVPEKITKEQVEEFREKISHKIAEEFREITKQKK
jgi:creatinine amidohydrolase